MEQGGAEAAGQRFGNYRTLGRIGDGGMSTVYLAEHVTIGRRVAIKVLHGELSRDGEAARRFVREARASAAIHHPGIVEVFDVGRTAEGALYIAMEFLEGRSLGAHLREVGRLEVPLMVEIARQVAAAIQAAHAKGVVHRDLKPDNVFLVPDAAMRCGLRVKVLDFGIAKIASERLVANRSETRAGVILGTPRYMSPEQIRAAADVDARTDVYALGCVMFEMAAGRLPFEEGSFHTLIVAILSAPFPSLRQLNPAVSPVLEALIARAAAREREERFATMAALLQALDGLDEAQATPTITRAFVEREIVGGGHALVDAREESVDVEMPRAEDAPATAAEAPLPPPLPPRPSSPPSSWAAVTALLGRSFAAAEADAVGALLRRLFSDALAVDGNLITLGRGRVAGGIERGLCLLMPERGGELDTSFFVDHSQALEEALAALPRGERTLVLVITAAPMLGAGVRRRLLGYRQERGAWVLPLSLAELCVAARHQRLAELVHERLRELHAPANPFADVGPKRDPLAFFGMASARNDLVRELGRPGALVVIAGRPRSGKSSLVNMAEYDSGARFIRVRCPSVVERSVDGVVRVIGEAITRALGPAQAAPAPADGHELRQTLFNAVPAHARRDDAVLVLEDVDGLLEPLAGSDAEERGKARALWATLAALCEAGRIGVMVTGVRVALLAARRLDGWENPVATHARVIEVGPLDAAACARYVSDNAHAAGLALDDAAVAAVCRWSAGHVDVARALGSALVSARPLGDALVPVAVSADEVAAAARDLAGAGEACDGLVAWLSPDERAVLDVVAARRPRSLGSLYRRLGGRVGAAEVRAAVRCLERLGLVGLDGGRRCVRIPLLEEWLRGQALPDDLGDEPRSLGRLFLGLGVTAAFLALWGWLVLAHRQPRHRVADVDGCTYEVFFDEYGAAGEDQEMKLRCRCARGATRVQLSSSDTAATFDEARLAATAPLTCDAKVNAARVLVHLGEPTEGASASSFVLGDGQRDLLGFAVRTNVWLKARAQLKSAIGYIAAVPLALGGLGTFYGDLVAALGRLAAALGLGRRRREPAPPSP